MLVLRIARSDAHGSSTHYRKRCVQPVRFDELEIKFNDLQDQNDANVTEHWVFQTLVTHRNGGSVQNPDHHIASHEMRQRLVKLTALRLDVSQNPNACRGHARIPLLAQNSCHVVQKSAQQ